MGLMVISTGDRGMRGEASVGVQVILSTTPLLTMAVLPIVVMATGVEDSRTTPEGAGAVLPGAKVPPTQVTIIVAGTIGVVTSSGGIREVVRTTGNILGTEGMIMIKYRTY